MDVTHVFKICVVHLFVENNMLVGKASQQLVARLKFNGVTNNVMGKWQWQLHKFCKLEVSDVMLLK